jgi:hypothetical protein
MPRHPSDNPPPNPLHLRTFLASPGDVAEERTIAREVIERLPLDLRCAARTHDVPDARDGSDGFRVVVSPFL